MANTNLLKEIANFAQYRALRFWDWRAGWQLRRIQDNTRRITKGSILLFACLRNERFRMPAFVEYYRRLGVTDFLFVDNGSTDGFRDWAREQPDVSVWYTEASYRKSRFGMLWLNDLLCRYGSGHWCVVVDPDEFLVYPFMETRSLRALTQFLGEEGRPCMHAVMLDAYSNRPLSETILEEGTDPFTVCPYIDRDGYLQGEGWGRGVWIRGGPRLRVHFRDNPRLAPALNKIPLVYWKRHYHYRMSMHDAWPWLLNRAHKTGEISVTGAIFHFKLVASLSDKAEEERRRGEHFAGGREYERYRAERHAEFFEEGISVRYEGSRQLHDLGLMSPGRWF